MKGQLAIEVFGSRRALLAYLISAELNARNRFEIEFTNSLRDRWDTYGEALVITPLQTKQLRQIAKPSEGFKR